MNDISPSDFHFNRDQLEAERYWAQRATVLWGYPVTHRHHDEAEELAAKARRAAQQDRLRHREARGEG